MSTLVLFNGCSRSNPSADAANALPTVRVEAHDIADTIEVTGEVVPLTLWEIKSEISGRVVRVHAQPGDMVKDGQLLVELDRTKLESDLRGTERPIQAEAVTSPACAPASTRHHRRPPESDQGVAVRMTRTGDLNGATA